MIQTESIERLLGGPKKKAEKCDVVCGQNKIDKGGGSCKKKSFTGFHRINLT